VDQPTHDFAPQFASFDRHCCTIKAGHLLLAVDWAIAKSIDDGAIAGTRDRVRANLCPKCDGTGYKDHAGFAMDPCDHG